MRSGDLSIFKYDTVPGWLFSCGEGNGFSEDGLEVAI